MSGLASFLLVNGYHVSGSDISKNSNIEELIKKGLNFHLKHHANNITNEINLVVYSGAIKDDNPEIIRAKMLGILIMERSEFLGEISKLFNVCISIAGTHGKTTTTAILSGIMMQTQLNPTISIGGNIRGLSNFIIGENKLFICEACEYRESFKFLNSGYSIITNIEADHLDYYKTFENLQNAFIKFASNVKQRVVTYKNEFLKNIDAKKIINCGDDFTFEYNYKIIKQEKYKTRFAVFNYSNLIGEYEIYLTQEFNIKNALLAIVMAYQFNISNNLIGKGLLNFNGVERRNEKLGEINGVPLVADYAHHPTEIKESLKGSKSIYNKILCVFQPHTYSRTKSLKKEFENCFEDAKEICFFKTYPAREPYDEKGCEKVIFNGCKNLNKRVFYDENKLFSYLNHNAKNFDVILVLGAGDLYDIIKKMLTK